MMQPNKYGGVQAARFGSAGQQQPINAQQQQQAWMTEQMKMDMEMDMDDSYGDEEYGDYDDEMDNMVASGDTEGGGALYQYGN